ncbi:MoaD/ThiS family protein [Spiractinospora alimapuensis]|uniref:MoaD/ThiS family protein n=1 Tax=Spiractinospora alimapuensis TaxID=2820884 RepID=UPI001F223449|nr:MoaD/ThiS family protein [Spiractinospora alimapuensis]QVQ50710.1 MoaD/ThiS family protein [Spiractinospora alimapuensis]
MRTDVILPQSLRRDADGAARVAVSFSEPRVPLRSVLDEVARAHPRLDRRIRDERGALRRFVNVFVDADECRALQGLDTPVPDGTEVRVLPSVAGG